MKMLNLKDCPFLIRLKKDDEEVSDLLKLPQEEILMRWFNYHLKNSPYGKSVGNFNKDLQDGEAYTYLLNQLKPAENDLSGLKLDSEGRAKKIIKDAEKLGVPHFLRPAHITNGV